MAYIGHSAGENVGGGNGRGEAFNQVYPQGVNRFFANGEGGLIHGFIDGDGRPDGQHLAGRFFVVVEIGVIVVIHVAWIGAVVATPANEAGVVGGCHIVDDLTGRYGVHHGGGEANGERGARLDLQRGQIYRIVCVCSG